MINCVKNKLSNFFYLFMIIFFLVFSFIGWLNSAKAETTIIKCYNSGTPYERCIPFYLGDGAFHTRPQYGYDYSNRNYRSENHGYWNFNFGFGDNY